MRVVILGAGVIGVTSAWYLVRAGHEVTLVERREQAGLETSYANGGQIAAGHAEPWARPSVLPQLLRWIGRDDAPLRFRLGNDPAQWRWLLGFLLECLPGRWEENTRALSGLARYSSECLGALRQETGIEYDRLAHGILHFCTGQREFEALAAHAESVRALGVVREVKNAAQCLEIEPALADSTLPIAGGVHSPQDESGDAHSFTLRLLELAIARGVSFMPQTNVDSVDAEAGRVARVRTSRGELSADAYVVALGSYAPRVLRPLGIRIPVHPLKGYSVTIPLEAANERSAPRVSLSDEGAKIVVSRLGNRLRAAGTAELAGFDTSINETRCKSIASRIGRLFPALASAGEVKYWAGLRPATPNNVPVIGRTRLPNLFLNTGHGTLGWTLACGSGRALADMISGRAPEVDFRFR